MHKLICSRCLQRVNCVVPSLATLRQPCSHRRAYSRWFALYEDVNHVEIPISELPSSSTYTHTAPIGLNDHRSTLLRRSLSSSHVPTSADFSELGGRDTVDDESIGSVLGMSTGSPSTSLYDLDSLLATVEEANLELPFNDVIPSRNLLPPSTLRGSSPIKKHSRASPEKSQPSRSSARGGGVRSRLASVSTHALQSAAIEAERKGEERVEPGQMDSEISAEVESTIVVRNGEMSVHDLRDIVERKDMAGFRSLLATSSWPRARLSPHLVSQIFTLVIEKAKNCEECRDIIRDFALASSRHSLPSHVLLLLATRSAAEEGLERANDALFFHHKAFMMAPMNLEYQSSLRHSATRSLWREVAKRSEDENAREMYETGLRLGLMDGPKEFVEETLKHKMKDGASFSSIMRDWKVLGARYGSSEYGMDTVVRAAMNERGEERKKALGAISSLVSSSPSLQIESFLVQIIVNLLEREEEKAARLVYGLVSLHGRHWNQVLVEKSRDESEQSLAVVEKIANLMTYGTIGELKRRGEKKMKARTEELSSEEMRMCEEKKEESKIEELPLDPLCEEMKAVVWKTIGGMDQRKKKKFAMKKEKKRPKKVDEKIVHDLAMRIQRTWRQLEMACHGPSGEGMQRLAAWSLFHKLPPPEDALLSHPALPTHEDTSFKRESGV